MSNRKDPWKRIGRPAYEGVHHMPFDVEHRAVKHELNRQRAVSMLFIDLYAMAVSGLIPTGRSIGLSGAASQSLSGSRTNRTAAAHCIPRQLLVGTIRVQDLLQMSFPERSLAVDALFGETDILPVNFNKSDSRAEQKGLCEAFRLGCQSVITDGQYDGALEFNSISMAVQSAYSVYREHAQLAFKAARRRLLEKIREIEGSRVQHTVRTKEISKWKQQLEITTFYADILAGSEGPVPVLEMGKVNGIITIYKMIGSP